MRARGIALSMTGRRRRLRPRALRSRQRVRPDRIERRTESTIDESPGANHSQALEFLAEWTGLKPATAATGRLILSKSQSYRRFQSTGAIVAEAARFPELGVGFYACGIDLAVRRMSVLLAAAVGRGELAIDDVELAAHQFLELRPLEVSTAACSTPRRPPRKAGAGVSSTPAVTVFIRAYAPAGRLAP